MNDIDGFRLVGGKKQNRKARCGKKNQEDIVNQPVQKKEIDISRTNKIKDFTKTMHYRENYQNKMQSKTNDLFKKRILCNNMFTYGKCPYNDECVYAHSLEEQKLDPIRARAYGILKSTNNLGNIDLVHDKELYYTFLLLTRLCFGCENQSCLGGFNCKNGAINSSYVICLNDLNFGKCTNTECTKIHLTKRGLLPYKLQDMLYNGYQKEEKKEYVQTLVDNIPLSIELKNDTFPKLCSKKTMDIDDECCSLSDGESSNDSCDECILTLNP